jgi:hypothetical protein
MGGGGGGGGLLAGYSFDQPAARRRMQTMDEVQGLRQVEWGGIVRVRPQEAFIKDAVQFCCSCRPMCLGCQALSGCR